MATKISQLATASLITSDDFFPIVDSGSLTTLRASAEQILNFVTSSTFNNLNITSLTGSSILLNSNSVFKGNIFVSGASIYGQVAELTSSTQNYTLVRDDSGKFLHLSSSSNINLTVPTGLPNGFTVTFCQNGTGSVTVISASGVVVKNRQNHTKTAGVYAVASLISTGSNGYIFTGDTTS